MRSGIHETFSIPRKTIQTSRVPAKSSFGAGEIQSILGTDPPAAVVT
jgi:hypothetical protein